MSEFNGSGPENSSPFGSGYVELSFEDQPTYLNTLRRDREGAYRLSVSPTDRRNVEAVVAGAQEGLYVFSENREGLFTNAPGGPGQGAGEATSRFYRGIELPASPVYGMDDSARTSWHARASRELRDHVLVLRTRSDSEPPAHPSVVSPRHITPVPEAYRKEPVDMSKDATTIVMAGLASLIAKGEMAGEDAETVSIKTAANEASRVWDEMAGAYQYGRTQPQSPDN